MRVVGGVYSEYCYDPHWHQIFGSGGRGAATLTRLGLSDVTLTTCIPLEERSAVNASLLPYGLKIDPIASDALYEFRYAHPLSDPLLQPSPPKTVAYTKPVQDDTVLVYGMLEGLPDVEADRLVYDPQSESAVSPPSFVKRARDLALVLNQREVARLGGRKSIDAAARQLLKRFGATTIVVKQGPYGCTVVQGNELVRVPVFPSKSVFKIGSGDVFSAAFAKFWGNDRLPAPRAAELASRCVSLYCESTSIDAVAQFDKVLREPRTRTRQPAVYLAGPFFSLPQKILVEEARRSLLEFGAKVFSPLHDVGFGPDARAIATKDIEGLRGSTVVLALLSDLDPGTIFEIGYARARNIPVVAYVESVKEQHLTMLAGSDCLCCEDFCSSLHNAIWAGMQ